MSEKADDRERLQRRPDQGRERRHAEQQRQQDQSTNDPQRNPVDGVVYTLAPLAGVASLLREDAWVARLVGLRTPLPSEPVSGMWTR